VRNSHKKQPFWFKVGDEFVATASSPDGHGWHTIFVGKVIYALPYSGVYYVHFPKMGITERFTADRIVRGFCADADVPWTNPYEHEGRWWFYDDAGYGNGPYEDETTAALELKRRSTRHVSPRSSAEFHKLDAPWEWRYFNSKEPAACLFTFEYDVVVHMRGGSVEISGTPGAVAPWYIVVAVIHANGYDVASVLRGGQDGQAV
jgi:hypothetical protein